MLLPDDFQLSQHSLQDFVDCPRRFQLRYLKKILWPALITEPVLEQEKRILMGANFHRYVQQYLSGIPAQEVAAQINDMQLETWWQSYYSFQSRIPAANYWVEHTLSIRIGNVRCLARYDYIFTDAEEHVHIVDWKTSDRVPKAEYLEKRIQSILYPCMLAEIKLLPPVCKVVPENLSMMYWFVNFPESPITFTYSKENLAADKKYLLMLIEQIQSRSPEDYEMTMDLKKCKFCNYRSLCERGIKAGQISDWEDYNELEPDKDDNDFNQIGEIAF